MKKILSLLFIATFFQLSFGQETKVGIGTYLPEAQLHIKGESTSGTKALKIENSAGSEILNVKNDGSVELTSTPSTSTTNYDILTLNHATKKIEKVSSVPVPESDPIWNQARVNTKTFKGNIPAASNLNNYLETGIYNTVTDNIASAGQNYPIAKQGELEVFNYESATYQKYQTGGNDNSLYIRNRNSSGWTSWVKANSSSTGLERIDDEAPYKPGWRLIGRNPNNYGNIGNGSVDFGDSSDGTNGGARGDYSFVTGNNHKMVVDANKTINTTFMAGEGNSVTANNFSGVSAASLFGQANSIGGAGTGMNANGWMNTINSTGGASNANGYRNTVTAMAANANGLFNYARAEGETSIGAYGTDYTATASLKRIFNVGIGVDFGNRKDGLSVFRDGKIKIGVEPVLDNTALKMLAIQNGEVVTKDAFYGSNLQSFSERNVTNYQWAFGTADISKPYGQTRSFSFFSKGDGSVAATGNSVEVEANPDFFSAQVIKGGVTGKIANKGTVVSLQSGSNFITIDPDKTELNMPLSGTFGLGQNFFNMGLAGGMPNTYFRSGWDSANLPFSEYSVVTASVRVSAKEISFKNNANSAQQKIILNDQQLAGTNLKVKLPKASGTLALQDHLAAASLISHVAGNPAPTFILLKNDFPVFNVIRTGVGTYLINISNSSIPIGKTVFFITPTGDYRIESTHTSDNVIQIKTFSNSTGVATDGLLNNTPVKIEVYP